MYVPSNPYPSLFFIYVDKKNKSVVQIVGKPMHLFGTQFNSNRLFPDK